MEGQNNLTTLNKSLGWTAALFALTAFHHYYGSLVYVTPWRAHVALVGGITLGICIWLIWLYRRYHSKLWLNSYLLIALIVFGLLIGLFEGFYNHTIKDILYFSGLDLIKWRSLFPAPAYELPDNLIFESTGVLQFAVGLVQIYFLYKVYKTYNQ
jgi:hypothetical protein